VIRVVVFDLDNTLYDATTVPDHVLAPAVSAVRRANVGPDAIPDDVLDAAIHSARRLGFLQVAEQHRLPPLLRAAWRDAYRDLVVDAPLNLYPDVRSALERLNLIKVLLTTGFRGMQESKIAALDIASLFHAIYIDALDGGAGPGKQALLQEILGLGLPVLHTRARKGDVRHTLADISLAERYLGYWPQVSFEEGIARTVEYFGRQMGIGLHWNC